ncbi:MAG: SMP-30/gluconolactonase/LRE family protein, partial [Desulfobacteraceae bacterium]|nr:SMP-30/gluconolactonase/LRE family protein [Desulfobacteraceae bacterium]
GNLPFNEPNDLWVAPDDGVYFTDPVYFASAAPQGGEHVYYLSPDRSSTIRVIDDMTRPNGLVGTADGSTLYVTDHGAGETYRYTVDSSGSLSDKQLFASIGADGMTLDSNGNVYLCCEDGVRVYDSAGSLLETISLPNRPTNACFGGMDGHTLFITTQAALYSLQMNVSGVLRGIDNPTTYSTLTGSSPVTVTSESISQIYGCAGANNVTIEAGAGAKLINMPGNNTITILADSSIFSVYRSGAMVTFEGTDGTMVTLPATSMAQSIVFNDKSLTLTINAGSVMIDSQAVETSKKPL